MANKKIQIKNTAGDNLFPVTKKQCIDDFAHAHSFTGNSITPSGTITLSRSANVALSTTSIGQITGVGSLPTRSSFTYNTLTVSGSTLCVASASAYQITGVGTLPEKAPVSVATGVQTQPNFTATFSGNAVTPTGTVGGVQDDPEDPKVHVNTGTFDPTSDDPAGQKSIMDAIIETDLNARFSRVSSGNLVGAFGNLPAYYSGKFHLLRFTGFYWGQTFDFSFLFTDTNIKEIDYSWSLNEIFEHAGAINMNTCFQNSGVNIISATYSLKNVKSMNNTFLYTTNLKTIKLRDYPVSFDISASTQFEESDLVEIIGNLVDLTGKTAQTLTMGATNLAKLTGEEKAVATNKNWVLA